MHSDVFEHCKCTTVYVIRCHFGLYHVYIQVYSHIKVFYRIKVFYVRTLSLVLVLNANYKASYLSSGRILVGVRGSWALLPVGEFFRDTDMDLNQSLIRSAVGPTATMQVSTSALHLHTNLLLGARDDSLLMPVVPLSEWSTEPWTHRMNYNATSVCKKVYTAQF